MFEVTTVSCAVYSTLALNVLTDTVFSLIITTNHLLASHLNTEKVPNVKLSRHVNTFVRYDIDKKIISKEYRRQ